MHAVKRRMPVERARHAKRLGHVQTGSGATLPIFANAANGTTTQQVSTSATSASSQTPTSQSSTQSSNSPPPSSATQSPSSPSSSAATLSTSPASSASAPPPTSIVPSSTLITQPTILTSTYPSASSTSQVAAATNSGLSGGAIAGIIAGSVIVGVALIVFFVRKTYLRRRERKDISWDGAAGLGASTLDEPKFPDISERTTPYTSTPNTPQRGAPLSPFEAHGQSMYSTPVAPAVRMQPPSFSTYGYPTPPPAAYNNPTPVAPYPTQPVSSTYGPGNSAPFAMGRAVVGRSSTLPSVRVQHAPVEAAVKCTFVPTLPDELSITTGERVFIVEQYDDGWDLCANGRGEQGMVPRECLERPPSDQPATGWGNVRRMSSLNPDGKRF